MPNAKRFLWRLLPDLSEEQHRRFKKWLRKEASISRKLQDIVRFYTLCRKSEDKHYIWSRMYPNTSYQDGRFRRIVHELFTQLKDFLAWEEFQQDQKARQLYQLKAISRLGNDSLFRKLEREFRQSLRKSPNRDHAYYKYLHELELSVLTHKSQHEAAGGNPIEVLRSLHRYFTLSSFFFNIAIKQYGYVSGEKVDTSDEALEKSLGKHDSFTEILQVYRSVDSILEGKAQVSEDFERFLLDKPEQFTRFNDFYIIILSHFIRQTNQEGIAFDHNTYKKIYEMLKMGIDNLILWNGKIMDWKLFTNFVQSAINAQYLDEIDDFAEQHLTYVPSKFKHDVKLYTEVNLAFARKEIDVVKKAYRKHEKRLSHPFLTIPIRLVILQIAYEELKAAVFQDELSFQSNIDSLMSYIQYHESKKRISAEHSRLYSKRVKLISRLFKKATREDLLLLRKKVRSIIPLNFRNWMMEQINAKIQRIA